MDFLPTSPSRKATSRRLLSRCRRRAVAPHIMRDRRSQKSPPGARRGWQSSGAGQAEPVVSLCSAKTGLMRSDGWPQHCRPAIRPRAFLKDTALARKSPRLNRRASSCPPFRPRRCWARTWPAVSTGRTMPRPAKHVGMRHRPGLRDGVQTSAEVRPDVIAPEKS